MKMFFNKKNSKLFALSLAAATAASSLIPAGDVMAAAPPVTVDEAVYINLDHYGEVEEVNVVKACSMNGNKTFTDYGKYTEVINLTNGAAPKSDGEKVSWDLTGYDTETFYFEGRSKQFSGELPWTIDVSYLLNGKPADADSLPGASGVVSTLIKAKPNPKAQEYFRNNMVLGITMLVDMQENNYSVAAPGGQLQSIGTKKAVVFMALPGEEGDFRVDVGSDSYESLGVFMAMMPATMSSLDKISDFREVKDKVRNSLDAMSDSADVIFDSLRDMRSSIVETREGLKMAREAKGTYDAGKDAVKSDADAAIESLTAIEDSLEALRSGSQVERDDYSRSMDDLETIRQSIYSADKYIKDMEDISKELEDSLNVLKKALEETAEESKALEKVKDALAGGKGQGADITTGEVEVGGVVAQLGLMLGYVSGNAAPAVGDSQELVHEIANLSARASEVLNEANALGGQMTGEYRTHLLEFIDQMTAFLNSSRISVSATKKALKSTRALMDAVEGSLSGAIDNSLSGLMGMLDGSLGIVDGTEVFRNAKDVMKGAVDDELDELEEDSNVLNLDTSQPLVSLTSPKNGTPDSIQIILRTNEIKKEKEEENLDSEPAPENITVGERVMNVVRKILPFVK